MKNQAVDMYEYHVWANKMMIRRLKELPAEVYRQQIQSVFPTIAKAMAHIYLVDRCWLYILSGMSMREALDASGVLTDEAESNSLEQLEELYDQLSSRFESYLQEQEDMERSMVIDNPYAGVRSTRISEIVHQIVNHGTYHRGNVTAMLRQMGHASVMTEYALFWYHQSE